MPRVVKKLHLPHARCDIRCDCHDLSTVVAGRNYWMVSLGPRRGLDPSKCPSLCSSSKDIPEVACGRSEV